MCCSFWEKCINSQKTGLGCSTPLSGVFIISTGHYSELNERVFYPERVTIPIKNIYVTRDIEPKRRIIIPKGHFS